MQSLPLYEAKPATLGVTVRQSAKMSLFIVIDLRDWARLEQAACFGRRVRIDSATRSRNESDYAARRRSTLASARPSARLRSSRAVPPRLASTDV